MTISLPVRANFGQPRSSFLLHGILMTSERALAARSRPIGRRTGQVWTPYPPLYPTFLRGIVWLLSGTG